MRASQSSCSILIPFFSPDGCSDCWESKTVWQDHLREFDYAGQICATENPTHLARIAFLVVQREMAKKISKDELSEKLPFTVHMRSVLRSSNSSSKYYINFQWQRWIKNIGRILIFAIDNLCKRYNRTENNNRYIRKTYSLLRTTVASCSFIQFYF